MRPRRTPVSTKVFRLSGGNEDNDLWVREGVDASGGPVLASVWVLTEEERRLVAEEGYNIELLVWGSGHPPVSLAVTSQPIGRGHD